VLFLFLWPTSVVFIEALVFLAAGTHWVYLVTSALANKKTVSVVSSSRKLPLDNDVTTILEASKIMIDEYGSRGASCYVIVPDLCQVIWRTKIEQHVSHFWPSYLR